MKKIAFLILTAAFLLATLCMQCKPNQGSAPNPCSLEPQTGPCKAAIPKYYYSKKDNSCKEFIWGGCGGVVPFNTLQDCQQQCGNGN
ncbi:hypothetical protein BVG80_12200 [Sphingobacteriales bacterium TSM_CSM]|nr:hypothetical protein BVG80_12200 [Sphingobacteriales bacterium TSM_CSM]